MPSTFFCPGLSTSISFVTISSLASPSLLVGNLHGLSANCSPVQCLSCRDSTIISFIFYESCTCESSNIDHTHFLETSIATEHGHQRILVVLVRNFAYKESIVGRKVLVGNDCLLGSRFEGFEGLGSICAFGSSAFLCLLFCVFGSFSAFL